MPEKVIFQNPEVQMQDDELYRLTRVFAALGFDKYRLTGGEPTLRRDIVGIVRHIAHLPGVREVSMTTNAMRLIDYAEPLAEAGLKRVNISLDSLNPDIFRTITRGGDLDRVWRGIEAAERVGLVPIKLNSVVVRGVNDSTITAMARLTVDHPWQVRFIELMPLGEMADFAQTSVVDEAEMRARIAEEYRPLELVNEGQLDGEARLFRFPGAQGTVGFISSVTQPFCAQCNRVRLMADGVLRLCLLQEGEVDLLTPLRAGASDEDLKQMIVGSLWHKPWGHRLDEDIIPLGRGMSQIGG
jgi:cyclic pyranopterin phosphate synthase